MSTEITIQQDQIDINVDTTTIVIESPTGGYPLPSSVYSVFGRVGNVVAQDGDYNLTQLGDVTITSPLTGQALVYNGTAWVNNTETYTGTVTSVNMSVPTGLTISGNPITTAGTLAVGLASGYSIPTTASQSNWDTAYSRSLTSAAVTGTTTKTLTLNEQGGGTITATWNDYDTAPVTSVFGRTGAITAQSGDYNTLLVTENTNLYFTDQRARFAISGDATSGVVYSNTTGIIALDDIPNTSLLHDSVTVNGSTVALGGSTSFTTSAVAEGTNLYYTQARFNTAFAAKSTTDLAEGTNLYFTTARAQAAISGTSPISVTSGNVSISQANSTTNGYLSSTDWNTFNSKQGTLTLTTTGSSGSSTLVGSTLNVPTYTLSGLGGIGLTDLSASSPLAYNNTTGAFSIQVANSSQAGYLTATDWSTFNDKQSALNGTGFVKISGTTISYDNSTYLTTISGIAAGGELSGTYANPSLVNSAVTGKVLTGLNITGGNVVATDTILDAFGKVQNQINGLIGGSIYKGTWNASTNTPTLTSSVGTAGWYYIVNVAGSTNLNGITDWNVGDWAIFNGGVWQKVDNTDAVVSVNGFTGAVSLTTSNISEGTNLYYTDARARNSVSGGTGISYNSTTGVITNSAPDQTVALNGGTGISTSGTYPSFTITNTAPDQVVSLTGAGTTSVTGTYPNFTITSNDQYVGTVTSVGITESSAALSITGSPVTTSGNINIGFAGSSSQYVAGDGSLVTFPTSISQASNLITEVYNSTGATLTKGTVVYINGGQGNLPTVTKAQANNDTNSAQTYGMVQNDITNMNNGYVVVIGNVMDLDTQAYAAGTQLYLSPTTPGAYTSTKQYAPNHLVYVGIVIRSHPTQGVIEVKIQNGYEMDELHNVSAQSPNNNDILQYKTSTSLWTSVAGTTSNISEGSNLYYTDARARGAVSLTTTGNNGASTYNSTTGVLNVPTYTLAGLGGINLSSLSATSPLLYNNTTGVFSIQQASGSQAGYLSSADWTTFNSKQSALSGTINTIAYWDSATSIASLSTATYPSLTELSYVKGVTSSIQTQLNGKQATLTNPVTGTGTTNYLPKFTGASTIGNSIISDNGTTATITGNLVSDGVYVTNGNPLRVYNVGNGDYGNLTFATATGFTFDKGARFSAAVTIANNSNLFLTNTKLGGDTNYNFDINYNTGGTPLLTWYGGSTTSRFSVKTNGSISVGTTGKTWETAYRSLDIGNGWGIMAQNANSDGYLCSNTYYNGQWRVSAQTGVKPTVMRIYDGLTLECGTTGSVDSVTTLTNLFTVTNSGNMLIGSTSDIGYRLYVQGGGGQGAGWMQQDSAPPLYLNRTGNDGGEVIFLKAGTQVGYIGTNAYSLPSDANFKKNIDNLELGLNLVSKLRPVSYNHKIDDEDAALSTGFIAQELEQSLLDLGIEKNKYYILQHVPNEKDGESQYWLDYQKMIPVLVNAINELNQKVIALENKS